MSRVYWYRWETYNDLWGIQMFDNTPGSKAFATLEEWIVGATFNGCNSKKIASTCNFTKGGKPFRIVYSNTEKPQSFAVKGASQMCTLLQGCTPTSGKVIKTAAPVKIG
jgi:hypothetical protein